MVTQQRKVQGQIMTTKRLQALALRAFQICSEMVTTSFVASPALSQRLLYSNATPVYLPRHPAQKREVYNI